MLKNTVIVDAHRGASVSFPENTLIAFEGAIASGTDSVEFDVQLSSDGIPVVIHDETVDRTTDGSGEVANMTLSELKSLRANYGRPEFAAERIPTLAEAAALVPDDIVLALELKTDRFLEPGVCQRLAAELDQIGIRGRSVVLSFSLPRLQVVRAVAPDIPIGWITLSRPWPLAGVQMLGPLWPLLLINPLYVRLAQRRGQVVCPLDPMPDPRLGLYRRLGCDAVLSNDPAATARALGRQE